MRVERPTQLIAYGKGKTGIKQDAGYSYEYTKRLQKMEACGVKEWGEKEVRGGEESERVWHEFW